MAEHNELGKQGEELATQHLVMSGYKIRDRNWSFRKAELDIVAEKDGVVVFVEVKTRSSEEFETPASTVTMKKQKQLVLVADQYLKSKELTHEARFDVIYIIHNQRYTKIQHIIEAFYPTT